MKQYSFFAALSISVIVLAMAFVQKETGHPDKHLEIVLRNIGHEILLHSKDSTSRVLPVETVNGNTFRISFEQGFRFIPDTLMKVVHEQLAKTDRVGEYTVSVNKCDRKTTVFAYEVNAVDGDLKPCRGREQKEGCYTIEISFPGKRSFNRNWLFLAFIPVAAGFYFAGRRNRSSPSRNDSEERAEDSSSEENFITAVTPDDTRVGDFIFIESTGVLTLAGETVELSAKEAKAFRILAANLNHVVGRDVLMKELWEDEGLLVITRNVDVLISKLRKKLSGDPSVKIVNVHGKGYKMMA